MAETGICRSMRGLAALHRAKVDIKDFDPRGLPILQQGFWAAAGKHLCGAATDFTLRCCSNAMQQATDPQCRPPDQGVHSLAKTCFVFCRPEHNRQRKRLCSTSEYQSHESKAISESIQSVQSKCAVKIWISQVIRASIIVKISLTA